MFIFLVFFVLFFFPEICEIKVGRKSVTKVPDNVKSTQPSKLCYLNFVYPMCIVLSSEKSVIG